MFTRHHGEEAVKVGTYLGVRNGEFVSIERDGDVLPGAPEVSYVKVSPIVALLIGPLAGLVFVIFLPLAVPALMLWLIATKLWATGPSVVGRLTFGSHPIAAYAGESLPAAPQATDLGRETQLEAVMDEMAKKLDGGNAK